MPVLPRTAPARFRRRSSSVPLRPVTAKDARNEGPICVSEIPARSTPARARAVRRSSDESPEPSTIRTPSVGMPAARIAETTTRPPAALEPGPPSSVPSCLSTISAAKLSLSRFIERTITLSDADRSRAKQCGVGRRRPEPGGPRDLHAARDERCPERAGGKQRRRLGGAPAAGAVDDERGQRRRLDADEPSLPPGRAAPAVVDGLVAAYPPRDPRDARAAHGVGQSGRRPAAVSVGSPYPLRKRSPRQVAPSRAPAPSTSVRKRKPVPRRDSAAQDTGSFSFDAGIIGRDALCA